MLYCFSSRASIRLKSERHTYNFSIDGFTEKVFIEGFCKEDDDFHVLYSKLEDIDDVYFESRLPGENWKKTKKKAIKADDAVSDMYFDWGMTKYSFEVLKQMEFRVSYTISSRELKLVSSMVVGGAYVTDTIEHYYVITDPYVLEWKNSHNDSLPIIKVDSTFNGKSITYRFTALNPQRRDLCNRYIYTSIHRKDVTAKDDLNKWMYDLAQKTSGISNESYRQMIPEHLSNDTLENIYSIFNTIRRRISYIAYEAGYGAWQPRNADFIVKNKKGDCKDMANVVHQCMKKIGVESYLACISALQSDARFVFPSASMFNHMICIARFRNNWIVLDATDDASPAGYPSQHTQGRIAFCMNEKSPFEITVPVVPADSNEIIHDFKLNYNDHTLSGKWKLTLNGIPAANQNANNEGVAEVTAKENYTKFLKHYLTKYSISNVQWKSFNNDSIIIECDINSSAQLFIENSDKKYISLLALPNPVIVNSDNDYCRWVSMQTRKESVITEITFAKSTKLKKSFINETTEDPVSCKIKADNKSQDTVSLQYTYVNNAVELRGNEIQSIQKVKKSFEKSLKSLLEIENQ